MNSASFADMEGDSSRFAGPAGIRNLYHYQDFQPHLHVDHLVDLLQNHRIFCSNPAKFNDPWDGKPYFDPALLDDPVKATATAEFFITNQRGGVKGDPMDRLLRTNHAALKAVVTMLSEHMVDFVPSRWGIYCLTTDPCSTLMWSHYARNHRGICLKFGTRDSKFWHAQEVRYQKRYPPLLVYERESYDQMLLIKSDDWWYEHEFRLICPRYTDATENPLIMDGDYLRIGATDLKSIILGCQADDETVKIIGTLAREHSPDVTVQHARRAPDEYRLVIEDL